MKTLVRFLPKQAAVIFTVAILLAASAHAEIVTRVEGETADSDLFKEFTVHNTPCRIEEFKGHDGQMAKFFADAGLNIVTDKDAKCVIVYDGYITWVRANAPDSILPLAEYDLLTHAGVPYVIPPALTTANPGGAMDKSVALIGARDGWRSTALDITSAVLTGSGLGLLGGIVGVGNSAAYIGTSAHGKMNTPIGIAHAGMSIKRKDWVGYTNLVSMHVYAASTTTESPAALLRAAVNGAVAELQAKEDVYYHREPKKVDAATTAASAPVAAPVIGDAAVSTPVAVPVVSEPAASAPLPVQVTSASDKP